MPKRLSYLAREVRDKVSRSLLPFASFKNKNTIYLLSCNLVSTRLSETTVLTICLYSLNCI